ncbi:hypothetical protein C8Q76DRAFT_789627 [Earliella scabrosa]|nr:hypothetical protein C8Q76DRAFT_789627 [Earliella scabrosa]
MRRLHGYNQCHRDGEPPCVLCRITGDQCVPVTTESGANEEERMISLSGTQQALEATREAPQADNNFLSTPTAHPGTWHDPYALATAPVDDGRIAQAHYGTISAQDVIGWNNGFRDSDAPVPPIIASRHLNEGPGTTQPSTTELVQDLSMVHSYPHTETIRGRSTLRQRSGSRAPSRRVSNPGSRNPSRHDRSPDALSTPRISPETMLGSPYTTVPLPLHRDQSQGNVIRFVNENPRQLALASLSRRHMPRGLLNNPPTTSGQEPRGIPAQAIRFGFAGTVSLTRTADPSPATSTSRANPSSHTFGAAASLLQRSSPAYPMPSRSTGLNVQDGHLAQDDPMRSRGLPMHSGDAGASYNADYTGYSDRGTLSPGLPPSSTVSSAPSSFPNAAALPRTALSATASMAPPPMSTAPAFASASPPLANVAQLSANTTSRLGGTGTPSMSARFPLSSEPSPFANIPSLSASTRSSFITAPSPFASTLSPFASAPTRFASTPSPFASGSSPLARGHSSFESGSTPLARSSFASGSIPLARGHSSLESGPSAFGSTAFPHSNDMAPLGSESFGANESSWLARESSIAVNQSRGFSSESAVADAPTSNVSGYANAPSTFISAHGSAGVATSETGAFALSTFTALATGFADAAAELGTTHSHFSGTHTQHASTYSSDPATFAQADDSMSQFAGGYPQLARTSASSMEPPTAIARTPSEQFGDAAHGAHHPSDHPSDISIVYANDFSDAHTARGEVSNATSLHDSTGGLVDDSSYAFPNNASLLQDTSSDHAPYM